MAGLPDFWPEAMLSRIRFFFLCINPVDVELEGLSTLFDIVAFGIFDPSPLPNSVPWTYPILGCRHRNRGSSL